MELDTIIEVSNRSSGSVLYQIPDTNNIRTFAPNETKRITYKELVDLAQQSGGRELIYNFLLVKDPEALREGLNVQEEREYWLTEAKIPSWITTCSLDEFKDALDYAPEGVKDLIKSYAVSIPLNDVAKREAIKETLGFDVAKAIEANKAAEDDTGSAATSTTGSKRRSTTSSIEVPAESSPYTVIEKKS